MNTGTATPDAAVIVLTGGQTDIHAEGVNESLVRAAPSGVTGGAEGGSVGVGASFALNILLADTIGEVEDGEDVSGTTGHFLVTADTTSDVITEAENGASGGGTSIGASIAIAVVENTTRAHIGSDPGGTITLARRPVDRSEPGQHRHHHRQRPRGRQECRRRRGGRTQYRHQHHQRGTGAKLQRCAQCGRDLAYRRSVEHDLARQCIRRVVRLQRRRRRRHCIEKLRGRNQLAIELRDRPLRHLQQALL
ncbi:hypothetical protein LP419_39590 [Massilia sp. H-1]|nr:hypothetical protein LP419_39590 [Massilia sp. H-1]